MKFTKMHGAGNDFVVVETSDTECDWSRFAVAICDRHFGIGADGLLLLMPSDKADCRMGIIDYDGTEAEACGNGLRCLVKYFRDEKQSDSADGEISVETIAGIRKARVYETTGRVTEVKTGMGEPGFRAADIPVVIGQGDGKSIDIKSMISCSIDLAGRELGLNLISMGNPHAVYFLQDSPEDFPLSELGPKVENLEMFPNRVNFEVARILDRRQIEARVWERGVGETLACGSGACAIAVAARLHGYIDNEVAIKLPGGVLEVEWDGKREVFLKGPAETVFKGDWPDGKIIKGNQ
ncbi:MAG: diaminopimelate epimerase [Dehalococcoidales bacterium]|nr:diaminopimelate epimerase [Dehalococcoidales bacterium]